MNLRPRRREDPELSLVPMIDVVLVLLIFFMVTTSPRHESQLELQLPEAPGRSAPEERTQLTVEIDAAGRYAINGRRLAAADAETLRRALREAVGDQEPPLTLRADGRTPHQSVVTVLEIAGQLGLKQLAIVTLEAADASTARDARSSPEP
ncbi:MAG: biopolymer transporter ExbD [Candidatus Competibacteraceae bacterium]|nr:biopolymer transporter ExbD [Candidatus Competibacteraceae bacterium]